MKIKFLIPFLCLFALLSLLWRELAPIHSRANESQLIGEEVPSFSLPTLYDPTKKFNSNELKGHVSLLNVFATWCYACALEHPFLMQIKNTYHVPIYGINYKDDRKTTMDWLNEHGNPYVVVGSDDNGDAAIDLGVYGTPETFVISAAGKIVYRHVGEIDQAVWDQVLSPLVKQYG